jgi:uncharacterized protein (TIGR02391 family)
MSFTEPDFVSADEAERLPLDELALRLLRHLDAIERSGTKIQNLNVISADRWARTIPRESLHHFLYQLQEAWDWLYTHGLIAGDEHTQMSGTAWWTFVTRRGHALLADSNGLARLRAEQRLDLELHARIRERVRAQFLLGEYELAAFAALREVEIRVREMTGESDSLVGVKLMTAAFRDDGALRDDSLDPGESVALMNLFQGAIGVFKNPASHRQVEYADPTEASEVVLLADLLLRVLDRIDAGADDS